MPLTERSLPVPLQVAISPCPNDTFAFYYFLNRPENRGKYAVTFCDIEELNRGLLAKKWDVVKASFVVGAGQDSYELLSSGSAIGYGAGPIAVYHSKEIFQKQSWNVGLPGEHTTANLLWDYYLEHLDDREKKEKIPDTLHKKFLTFSDVLKKTASGELDVGVVIHEGRFVYKDYDLELLQDLGEFWEKETTYPVPLGGIFIRKDLPPDVKKNVGADLKESVEKALLCKSQNNNEYQENILSFIKNYSQELSDDVLEKHIEYYVNADTVEISQTSREGIELLMDYKIRHKD